MSMPWSCTHLSLQVFRTLLPKAGSNSCWSGHGISPQFHMTTVSQLFQRFSTLHSGRYKVDPIVIDTHWRNKSRNRGSVINCSNNRNKSSSVSKMSGKGPGLIVFDLDCTLWPFHVDTTVNPPFVQQENSKVVDQNGETMTWYPEVPQVLEYLKSEGYPIAAASRTTKPPDAFKLLEFFGWTKYFSYKEIYPGSKITHFAKFVEQTKVPHNEMLFFDDEQRNIADMKNQGVKCVFVTNGVNMQLVKDSIQQFKEGKL
ncbi:Magnesium-dependent phosphatase 1 [Orchesella cincta]|uniref:Magnesium-dependent phosphatase 1 n=1 Tax=Orchesella cincta TaxID=48709 RepID=A0A1D2N7I2_ORCCI|nr:Magnesium-dependent phosphatase 1 [Orchesella cincta]